MIVMTSKNNNISNNKNNRETGVRRLGRWKQRVIGKEEEEENEKEDGGKINNPLLLEKQTNINTSTKIINNKNNIDDHRLNDDDQSIRTATATTTTTMTTVTKMKSTCNNNTNSNNQIISQLNASQLESSTSNITSSQQPSDNNNNNNNVNNNKSEFVFLRRFNNNINKSESSSYSSSLSSSIATNVTTNLDNRCCYCIDCKGKNGRQELRNNNNNNNDEDEEHEKQLVELDDRHDTYNNKHDKSISLNIRSKKSKKQTTSKKKFNLLSKPPTTTTTTSVENNNQTNLNLDQTQTTLNNHILRLQPPPINKTSATHISMISRILLPPRMTLTFSNDEQESETKRRDCECHFGGSEMMMLNEPVASRRSMILLDYTESSSPRSCFDSSNGSSSIISNLSSTSSSNNSSLVATIASVIPSTATATNRSSNEFDDDDDDDAFDETTHKDRQKEEEDIEIRAFDNLTYLSSHEDLTSCSTNPTTMLLVNNPNEEDNDDDDDEEPQLNIVVGDLLVKKTLKSIKRKDKLKKEAAKSNLFNSHSSVNQSMPDLTQSQFQSSKLQAQKLNRSKSMASNNRSNNMTSSRRKWRSLDDLIFSGSDEDNNDDDYQLARSRNNSSSRNSSLASASEVSEVSLTSSLFCRQLEAWSPELSSSESDDQPIFDSNFDWDTDLNLSTNASHSSSPIDSDEEEFVVEGEEIKNQRSCVEIVKTDEINGTSEINEMFNNPNVKLSPNLLDKMLNDVLSNLLENYPILNNAITCSKTAAKNLSLKFFQITKDNIKTISTNCFICSTAFDVQEEAVSLSCNHLFHKICLQFWLSKVYSCPICELQHLSKIDYSESSKKNAFAFRETLL